MTLAQRLLLSISVLVILATAGLSLAIQTSWRRAEEAQFAREFSSAKSRLEQQLREELEELPRLLEPLCAHSQMVDDPLTSLLAGGIPQDRRFALSLLAGGTRKAFGFDEFLLFTSNGEILGAHRPSLVGSIDPELSKIRDTSSSAELVVEDGVAKVTAHCFKEERGVGVGLVASRHLDRMLSSVGTLHGLTIGLVPPEAKPRFLERIALPALSGLEVYVSPKRSTLDRAIEKSTRTILLWGAITLTGALILGWWFARRLAIPIEQLVDQVEQVAVHPGPIQVRGPPEIRRLAAAFHRAVSDLSKLQKRLAATERIAAQREIARRVAHEIKNPLAPIRAAIETLRRLRRRADPAFDTYFDEATETVLSEVTRITTIVKEFTEFARMPSPKPAPLKLSEVLRGVVSLHQTSDAKLEVEHQDLPEIVADRDQVTQVLTNLVQNAIDAVRSRDDGQVTVRARPSGEFVEISVSDNGPGVPENIRDRLFQPYVTSKSSGTGLGLAIAQKIAVEHGGDIRYVSRPDGGARFEFRLPVSGPSVSLETTP